MQRRKKLLKNQEKGVDIPKKGWYISRALERAGPRSVGKPGKFFEFPKISLDIRLSPWYYNKAAAERRGRECTLKIEQCKKKKLMQISTREGFFESQK